MDAAALTLPPVTDAFAAARKTMVDSQLRPNQITSKPVLDAMRRIPRERFLPADRQAFAYLDTDVPLAGGRAMLAPMTIGKLLNLLAPRPDSRALVIGAGTLYAATVLANCAARVTALEAEPALTAIGAEAAASFAPNLTIVTGPLAGGWQENAPYDLILIEGGITTLPASIAAQLVPVTGRLAAVQRSGTGAGRAVLGEAAGGHLHLRPVFDCQAPLLACLAPPKSFAF
jgi:protein-L-isoaspartate(D-aspartate) O-methyltransferase